MKPIDDQKLLRSELDDYIRLAKEYQRNLACQFSKRPEVGTIVFGYSGPMPQAKNCKLNLEHLDRMYVEEVNRIRVEPFGYATPKNEGYRMKIRTYRITEVGDWWNDNRPLTEPDYYI